MLLDIALTGGAALEAAHFLLPLGVLLDDQLNQVIDRLNVGKCLLDLVRGAPCLFAQALVELLELRGLLRDLRDLLLVPGS